MEIATKSRPVSAADAPIDPTKKSCHAVGSNDAIHSSVASGGFPAADPGPAVSGMSGGTELLRWW